MDTDNQIELRRNTTDADQNVVIDRLGREPLDARATPAACLSAAAAAHRAGRLPHALPKDAARSLALIATDAKDLVVESIRTGMTVSTTQSADVTTLRTTSAAPLLLPGDQPRGASNGGRPLQAEEPEDVSHLHHESQGLRALRFRDLEHLRRWVVDAIERSLAGAVRTDKSREIAATGVRRPLVASLTMISFQDDTPSQWVAMVHDGITRLSLCLAALLEVSEQDHTAAAETIGSHLIPHQVGKSTTGIGLLQAMRRSHERFVGTYRGGLVDGEPDEGAVSVRQHLMLPIDLHVSATDPRTGDPVPLHRSMVSLVADAHTGVQQWEKADFRLYTARRALTVMANRGQIADGFNPAQSRVDDGELDRRYLLRRAVRIVSHFFAAETYEATKRALRDVTTHKALKPHQVMAYLAPLMFEPWGVAKPDTEAWTYGGVAIPAVVGGTFAPTEPEDYRSLVGKALGDAESEAEAARIELAVAGGIALIVDGLLTATLSGGAGASAEQLAFRGSVSDAVDALSRTESGLTALALAANAFDPTAQPKDVRHAQVDLEAADGIARDGAGKPVRMTAKILAQHAADGDPRSTRSTREPTPNANNDLATRISCLAERLPFDARTVLTNIEHLVALLDEVDAPATSGMTRIDQATITRNLVESLAAIGAVR